MNNAFGVFNHVPLNCLLRSYGVSNRRDFDKNSYLLISRLDRSLQLLINL